MTLKKANIFVARTTYAPLLKEELADRWQLEGTLVGEDAVAFKENVALPHFQATVFARQYLPQAVEIEAADVPAAVATIVRRLEVASQRPNRQTGRWTMHAFAPDDNAAMQLAAKLEKAVLGQVKAKLGRFARRYVAPDEIVQGELLPNDFVVQIYASSVATAWLSIGTFAVGISPWIGGNLRMRHREGAPSRSARKIEEAFLALGRLPKPGETAVDLGAAPGGWTFALARRGAAVTAIDAADLSLPETKTFKERVHHVRDNGLFYNPPGPVDWMVCDMIVKPDETLKVLSYWLEKGLMRHFIVNLKLPKAAAWASIKSALELLEKHGWPVMKGRHLFHDRWEITLVGSKDGPDVKAEVSPAAAVASKDARPSPT